VTREELETLPYHQGTDRTPADAESLTADLELARKTGYTINDEQTEWGYRIIGVPVLDRAGTARFALGIRGTTQLMIPERIPFLADLARVTAGAIAATLFRDAARIH
jgi:DNA-binding IclR family transcriptional regulator